MMLPLLLLACAPEPSGHGHSHGGHDHGGGDHGDHGEEDGTTLAITRWTDSHELFVELDAPVAGQRFGYHAHVTRMDDNHAATEGALTFRFEQDGFPAESHTDGEVARPGIFAADAAAPRTPGPYQLFLTYVNGSETAEWDAGTVVVGAGVPVAGEEQAEGEVTFLKETQWQIPFAVAPAAEQPLASSIVASGVVRPSPDTTALVAAPLDGLLAWADTAPVVGRTVKRGDRLATLVPAGQAESWSRLQADLSSARVDRELAQKELARVEGLVAKDLLPARRLEEARAKLEIAESERSASARRVGALTSGNNGGVAIRAPADGVIVAVGATHGEEVHAGVPLVSVATGSGVLVEARVHDRTHTDLGFPSAMTVMRGGWEQPVDVLEVGGHLLTEQLVFDGGTLSAPLTVQIPGGTGLVPGDLVELTVAVGDPTPRLVIPRSAVVEINGTDVVFVQKTGESFTRRRVTLGDTDGTRVEVLEGIAPGEMVVTQGGFDVHVASLSGALESHKH
ncbi:MAG: efflux RND transporter periplasmic adaptor subunit [Myxococcales bacterium]|nr:efflux RND transporter periplasmic adaptor subunit [Myxococcales bacterium]